MNLRAPPCPVCLSEEIRAVSHPEYAQCSKCESVFQISNLKAVEDYYTEIEESPNFHRQSGSYHTYLKKMTSILGDIQNYALIDVGGGDGLFVRMAQKMLKPREVAAVETSETARTALREAGIPVLESSEVSAVGRKVVVSLQVLEHISNPVEFLESFGLRAGDYLVLTSPAVDAIYFRLYGRFWRSYSPSHHLILYSRKALEIIFERAGIELLYYEHCVSGAHGQLDELIRFSARVILWPIRRMMSKKYTRVQLFHGKASFLSVGVVR